MAASLKIFAVIVVVTYFIVVIRLLRNRKFLLKYSLLWLLAGGVMLVVILKPEIIVFFANKLGIQVASNGMFAVCILLEIIIMISMTAALSDFSERIKSLTQNVALLEKRIRELEGLESENSGANYNEQRKKSK